MIRSAQQASPPDPSPGGSPAGLGVRLGAKHYFIPWRHLIALAWLVLMAGLAAFEVHLTTSHGVGLRDDSFTYISSAEALAQGLGYGHMTGDNTFKLTTNFPPLYSALLAAVHLTGLDLPGSARLVGGLTFGVIVLLTGLAVLMATGSGLAAGLAGTLIVATPALIEANTWALSEGLYISLSLAVLTFTVRGLADRDGKPGLLPLAGAALGLSLLTRYIGIALVASALITILITPEGPLGHRLRHALWPALIALLPLGFFLARNLIAAESLINRPLPYFHPMNAGDLTALDATILGFFDPSLQPGDFHIPAGIPTALALMTMAGVAAAEFRVTRARSLISALERRAGLMAQVSAAYAFIYILFLLFARSFLDRLIPFNSRIMSPLIPIGVIMISIGLSDIRAKTLTIRGAAGMGLLLIWVVVMSAAGISQVRTLSEEGLGFSNNFWRSSKTMEVVRLLPADTPIYTNNLPAIYFLSHRFASAIPQEFNPADEQPSTGYASSLAAMRRRLRAGHGVLVILGPAPWNRVPAAGLKDLTSGMSLISEYPDGLIFAYQ
jgi:hypothetical protein